MRVAALSMMYNEPVWAGVWARHYARQVGAENCFVLDHGTDDGSLEGLGVQVEALGRSALDEDVRARVVSERAAALLTRYDAVVHSDADELVFADPGRYADLRAYAAVAPAVTTAVGLDLQHRVGVEAALDVGRELGAQRGWVRFSGAMCKPALVRRAVRWGPGFHACDAVRTVGALYLVHLRFADLAAGLRRLARTRGLAFAQADANEHQRVSDGTFEGMMRAVSALPEVEGGLEVDGALVGPWLARMWDGWEAGEEPLGVAGDALWRLPAGFREVLSSR